MARLLAWLRGMVGRRRVERDAAEELQFHIEAETGANISRGMTPIEARRAALRDLGGLAQVRESVRDVRRLAPETWLQDVSHALRGLRRAPGFSTLAIVVLGLGIGLNATVFSVFNAVFLRSFHVPREHELVFVRGGGLVIQAIQEHSRDLFAASAGFGDITSLIDAGGAVEELDGEIVSAAYFDALDVRIARGRGFEPREDDYRDANRSVVISHALWQRRFSGSPDAIGASILVDDQPFRVVGIASEEFVGLSNIGEPTEFWVPKAHLMGALAQYTGLDVLPQIAGQMVARLRPGVTASQAERMLNVRAEAVAARGRELGDRMTGRSGQQFSYRVVGATGTAAPLDPSADLGPARALVAAAGAIVVLVLTIAAANLAGLLMARGIVRRHEIAIRRALGAGLGRLVRQLLTESAVVGLAAAALGLAVAWLALTLYRAYSPARFLIDVPMDARVVLFGAAVGMAAGVLLGLLPARQAATVDVLGALEGGERTGPHRRVRQRLGRGILVPQLALSVGLLVVAGAQMRGLVAAETTRLGVDTMGVALIRTRADVRARDPIRLRAQLGHADLAAASRARYLRLLDVVRAEPGVASAALASMLPISVGSSDRLVTSRGSTAGPPRSALIHARPAVSEGFFATLGITLVLGRDFGSTETPGSPRVAIVSEELARTLWPGQNAIGEAIAWADGNGDPQPNAVWHDVIGVVSDTRPPIPTDAPTPAIYFATAQLDASFTPYTLVVKGRARAADARLLNRVRRAIAAADPDMRLLETRTLDEKLAEDLFPRRAIAWVVAGCGTAGLLLAAVGLYGVISFTVARRRRDFGIRATLGARPHDLVMLVLRDGLRLTALGVPPGLLLGALGLRLTTHLAGPIQGFDWGSLVVAAVVICAVIFLACYLPARRAAAVDAMQALREA